MERIYLAIDSGTTKLKAALVSAGGRILHAASRSTTVEKPHEGYTEMDMDELYALLCSATRELAEKYPQEMAAVRGMGISGQGDGCWPIDRDGRPVGKAMLWCDTRAKSTDLPNRAEITRFLSENHCTSLVVGTVPTSLRWMRDREPERYRRVRWALHCKDWLNYCLTGEVATDYSDRSTAVINVITKQYLPEQFALMGIPEAIATQPEMRASTEILGRVSPEAAAATGIPAGTPVIEGALDVAAVALGVGLTQLGDACAIMGTSLCNIVLMGEDQVDHRDTNGSILCSVFPDLYLRQMATINGCSAMDWAKSVLAPELSYAELDRQMAEREIGAGGVIFQPYLNGARAPFRDPDACAGFYGLTARATREDLLRAAYEGVVMSVTDCFRHLPACNTLTLSGGGAHSDLICQLIADSLGRTVQRPSGEELGILGIARAVALALGEASAQSAPSEQEVKVFLPEEKNHQKLSAQYERYVALAKSMQPHWASRAEELKDPQ